MYVYVHTYVAICMDACMHASILLRQSIKLSMHNASTIGKYLVLMSVYMHFAQDCEI